MKLFGYNLRIELFLTILFLVVPIILPLLSGCWLLSLSEYHYTSQKWIYIVLMGLIGSLMALDGFIYKVRRYNILIGLSMIMVICLPVNSYRISHDIFAIIFFLGNAFIVSYYSKLLTLAKKLFFIYVIISTLILFLLGYINLFITESIGMLSMSYFMFIRYSILELKRKLST